ncbi:uncharacterized protein EDB93DRAFT_1143620 [Suillus bovinus]|uniref:uncharacterized protein n=1 Tax=Suillus bovinus TaxID=48563 RepID=UPI001B85C563|nr:uncharacterized protein EDB93DRAFT_1143620 [Suillus bovinus]KAG2149093.1 hypothetical protein EDB93DRAFT_1143620 [Suillus bovinus]
MARETLHGHRYLMTFGNGARMRLGKLFALTGSELEAVIFVLVRNFVFEMANGAEVQIVESLGFLPRPRVFGTTGILCTPSGAPLQGMFIFWANFTLGSCDG